MGELRCKVENIVEPEESEKLTLADEIINNVGELSLDCQLLLLDISRRIAKNEFCLNKIEGGNSEKE